MENLQDNFSKYFLFLFFIFLVNCKNENNKTIDNNHVVEKKCLSNAEANSVKKFIDDMSIAFSKNDTTFVSNKIVYPYISNDSHKADKDYFIKNDYEILKNYLAAKNIPEDEKESLNREEYFELEKNTSECYSYVIYNTFEELEFTVVIYITKNNNQFKISKIMLAG